MRETLHYLDYLAQILNCEYLSDLRYRRITEAEGILLCEQKLDAFSLQDYTDAAQYLTGQSECYPTPEVARRAILDRLARSAE